MKNNKTISYLNDKVWYRFLKVSFIFIISAIVLFVNTAIILGGIEIDVDKTVIYCTAGDKKTLTPEQAGVSLFSYQFQNGFNYKNYFEGNNDDDIRKIFSTCYNKSNTNNLDIFAIQRIYEIRGEKKDEELSQEDKDYISSQIKEITSGYKSVNEKSKYLDYSFKLFNINPAYNYLGFIGILFLANLLIFFIFEVFKRCFYYIALGTVRPKK